MIVHNMLNADLQSLRDQSALYKTASTPQSADRWRRGFYETVATARKLIEVLQALGHSPTASQKAAVTKVMNNAPPRY